MVVALFDAAGDALDAAEGGGEGLGEGLPSGEAVADFADVCLCAAVKDGERLNLFGHIKPRLNYGQRPKHFSLRCLSA